MYIYNSTIIVLGISFYVNSQNPILSRCRWGRSPVQGYTFCTPELTIEVCYVCVCAGDWGEATPEAL